MGTRRKRTLDASRIMLTSLLAVTCAACDRSAAPHHHGPPPLLAVSATGERIPASSSNATPTGTPTGTATESAGDSATDSANNQATDHASASGTDAPSAGEPAALPAHPDPATFRAIVDLRNEFGSVLADTELDAAAPHVAAHGDETGSPDAFAAKLQSLTGVTNLPEQNAAPDQPPSGAPFATPGSSALRESLRLTSHQLRKYAVDLSASQADAAARRYRALADLIDAEAALLELAPESPNAP